MLSTGKIMPDRSMVGIISTSPEASMAATCVCVRVEMSRPSESDTKMKSSDTATSHGRLPATGTWST